MTGGQPEYEEITTEIPRELFANIEDIQLSVWHYLPIICFISAILIINFANIKMADIKTKAEILSRNIQGIIFIPATIAGLSVLASIMKYYNKQILLYETADVGDICGDISLWCSTIMGVLLFTLIIQLLNTFVDHDRNSDFFPCIFCVIATMVPLVRMYLKHPEFIKIENIIIMSLIVIIPIVFAALTTPIKRIVRKAIDPNYDLK